MYLFWLFSLTHSYFLLVLNFQQKQEVKVKLLSLSSQHHIYTSPSIGNLYLYCFLLIRFLLIKMCSSFEKMSAQQKLCDTCGINFEKMSKFAFNEHMLKHKEKTHQCDKCTSIFHTARDLRYHKLKVHCKKVFCECCNIAFSNKTNLQKHVDKNVQKADVPVKEKIQQDHE